MPTTRSQPPLNRAQVLESAVALADAEGIDAVSMRALASRLGVVPMAMYKHVADKQDLTSGMIDVVVSSYALVADRGGWAESVRGRVFAARASLAQHPWLRQAIEAAKAPTPAVLAHMNAIAGSFVDGGFTYDLTHHAMHALGHRIWGFNPEAFATTPSRVDEPVDDAQAGLMAAQFPHIAAVAQAAASSNPSGRCDEDDEFAFTLDLLLDGFERLRRAGWNPGGGLPRTQNALD
jgi:AcrR family transcriptional regulator